MSTYLPSYDSPDGIKDSLSNLSTFNALVNARHEAGYVRREVLNQYLVLGRWRDPLVPPPPVAEQAANAHAHGRRWPPEVHV